MQLRDLFNELPVTRATVVPLALRQLLNEPLDVHHDWPRAEGLLLRTRELLPEALELPMALYKMYAYTNRFSESLTLIHEVLNRAATQGGFNPDWRQLAPGNAPWDAERGPCRIYLYSLKALGFVLLRNGEAQQAGEVLEKLQQLDPQDRVGGSVVREMAHRVLREEEE